MHLARQEYICLIVETSISPTDQRSKRVIADLNICPFTWHALSGRISTAPVRSDSSVFWTHLLDSHAYRRFTNPMKRHLAISLCTMHLLASAAPEPFGWFAPPKL